MDIGFIGLGSMGGAMVENLLKAGHRVRVWDRSPERAQALAGLGAEVVGTPAEALTGDAVFSMLADDAAARAANFTLASAVETLGEAAALVAGHGVATQDYLDVITSSVFPGPVYQGYGKMIAEGRYEPALFKARLGLKDVRLALAAGDAISTPLPIASVVRDSLLDALAHGDGEKDFAVLGRVAARRAGR